MLQAVSHDRDYGDPSLVPGFFVAGGLMDGVQVGFSPVTSGFPCIIIHPVLRNRSFTYNRRHISLATGSFVQ